jgi:glycosyltransferase involved in cell wall biosynthesis
MHRKPKIAVIGLKGLPAFGGTAAVGEQLIEQLKQQFDFTVLATGSHASADDQPDGYRQLIFKNHGKGGLNTFLYYWKCLFHCLFHRYDLVHIHHAASGFITPLLRLKYKVITTFHGIHISEDPKFSSRQNRFFRFSQRMHLKYAHVVISVSKPDQETLLKKYGKEVHYIPNGITLQKNPVQLAQRTDPYLFFAAGRIYEIKGLHLLLQAAHEIDLQLPIRIAGDAAQVKTYSEELVELGQELPVSYLGLIRDKKELMQLVSAATLFIFPSLTEAMSMMLLEVVSMQTPVIASDIPANKAILATDEVLFFESGNAHDLAEKISYALDHPQEMKARAEKAYAALEKDFTWDRISAQYAALYLSLIHN